MRNKLEGIAEALLLVRDKDNIEDAKKDLERLFSITYALMEADGDRFHTQTLPGLLAQQVIGDINNK